MKAQIATEYMMIIAFALLILVPYTLYLTNVSQNFSQDNSLAVASNSIKKIGQNADWVYSQGMPSKLEISVMIPDNVENITISGKSILCKIRTSAGISDVYYDSIANLTGNLTTSPGYYNVIIQAVESGVQISVGTG
jgi:hypothetical protein